MRTLHPGREQFRLFCILDKADDEANRLPRDAIAVIDGGPRTATIGAESAVSALELTRPALLRLIDREPGVARAMYDQLQRHRSEPQSVTSADVQVTREMLVDLCAQLRRIDQPDFAKVQSSKRRWLGLSRLFARGE